MKKSISWFHRFVILAAVVGVFHRAHAVSTTFWAINQFTTIQSLNGDTGAVLSSIPVPVGSGSAASIAVIGTTGYYTLLGDTRVYKIDMTTGASLGVAFTTSIAQSMNSIAVTADNHLWFAHGGSGAGNVLQEYDTAGTLLSSHLFPTSASSYRDGLVVFNGLVVANRGDQIGPYDMYSIPAGNGPLAYVAPAPGTPFITALGGNNGIAFNGVNFYISNEQTHIVTKYDLNGVFVSQANLPANSRYENWTFAAQDLGGVIQQPNQGNVPDGGSSLGFFGFSLMALAFTGRRRSAS
ncbi:NHL repeat-containing protein [Horticoccus sp. 23ND18S-11]|uniref:hypothetical protein n=1 Tax=Horticoccus sp. 23ND18S-11 TaxID=3391832 RepID=UPI0039C90A24